VLTQGGVRISPMREVATLDFQPGDCFVVPPVSKEHARNFYAIYEAAAATR